MAIPSLAYQGSHCKWWNNFHNIIEQSNVIQTETTKKMRDAFCAVLFCIIWNWIHSQRGLRQTISLPFQMSWKTDVLGSCANTPLYPSVAPVCHPGDSGELHEHHLLTGKHHCWNNPPQTAILLPYGTPLSVYSAKTKTQSCDQRPKLFPEVFVQILQFSVPVQLISYAHNTQWENEETDVCKFSHQILLLEGPHMQPCFQLKGILC